MKIEDLRRRYAGFSDDEIVEALRATKYQQFSPQEIKDVLGIKPPKRSLFEAATDTAASFGRGAVKGVRMFTDLAGADNPVSTGLRTAEDFIGELRSAQAKGDEQRVAAILKEAEDKGIGEQVAAGIRAFAVSPGATLAEAAGTSVPTVAAAVATGGTSLAGSLAARALPAAVGAAQGVGAVKGTIYDEVYGRAKQEGRGEEEARALAEQAQAYGGENAAQLALGGGLGALAGGSGMERAAQLLKGGGAAAPRLVRRVAGGAAAEAVPEALQGGQEQYAGNVAQAGAGFPTEPWAGVVASGTMEAIAGGALGGAISIPKPAQVSTKTDADLKTVAADLAMDDLGKATTVDQAVAAFTAATDVPVLPGAPQRGGFDDDAEADMRAVIDGLDPAERREYLQMASLLDNPRTPQGVRRAAGARMAELTRMGTVPAVPSEVREDELLPTGEAAELTDAERAAYAAGDKTPDQQLREQALRQNGERIRAKLGLPPAVEATELLPTGDALEVEPIPAGDAFEDIPTADAAEVLPVGDAAEVLPTPDVLEEADPVPAGEATDIEPEQADEALLLTNDGMPYGTLSGARVRAKREGLPPEAVVDVPGGWAVKKESKGEQPDVAAVAGQPPGAGDGRGDNAGRGGVAVGSVPAKPGAVVQPAAGAGAGDRANQPVADGRGADPALTVKALSAQWAEAVARGDMAEAKRLNDAIVEARKPPEPAAPPPAAEPAEETREQAIRRVWREAPRKLGEWAPITVQVGDRKNDMLATQRTTRSDGKGDSAITMRVMRMGKRIASEPLQPLMFTFKLTGENKVEQVGTAKVPSAAEVAEWEAAGFTMPGKAAQTQQAPAAPAMQPEVAAPAEQPAPAADQEPVTQQPVVAPEVPAPAPAPEPEPVKQEAPTKPPEPPPQTPKQELIELRKRAAVLKQLLECLG